MNWIAATGGRKHHLAVLSLFGTFACLFAGKLDADNALLIIVGVCGIHGWANVASKGRRDSG